jgi:hypothetical protein
MGVMPATDAVGVQPRSSIEKAPIIEHEDEVPSAFERLPDEIITQYGHRLLYDTVPWSFAALT